MSRRRRVPSKIGALILLIPLLVPHVQEASGIDLPSPSLLKSYLNLDAEQISISRERGALEATGGVNLVYEKKNIRAGKLTYYYYEKILELSGGVEFTDEDMEFSFSKVSIDIKNKKSVFHDGYIHAKGEHLIVNAERFEEITEDRYKIFKANFTTCDECEKADWRLNIRRGTLNLGGYAIGKNITVDIRDQSVFWLPFAFFPAKTKRESGFLVPSFQTSETRGEEIILPFYLVTSYFSDLTLYADYMTKRGFKPEAEFRYRLTEYSWGRLTGAYIDDTLLKEDRYRATYSTAVTGDFPFFATSNIDYVSDTNYYIDFVNDIYLRTARQVISNASTGYEGKSIVVDLYGTYMNNIERGNNQDTEQVVPAFEVELKKRRVVSPVFGRAVFGGKNFYISEEGGTQKGFADVQAEIPVALGRAGLLNLYANLYDGIYYLDDPFLEKKTENYVYLDSIATLKSSLSRRYELKSKDFVHRIEPYLSFRYTERVSGASPVNFEPVDKAPEKTRITVGLENIFTSFYGDNKIMDGGVISLKYSYDFRRNIDGTSTLTDPFSEYWRTYQDQIDIAIDGTVSDDLSSDLYLGGYLRPTRFTDFNVEGFFNTREEVVDKFSFGFKYDNREHTLISLAVRHTRDLATDLHGRLNFKLFRWLRIDGWVDYSLKEDVINENTTFLEYIPRSQCWSLTLGRSRTTRPAETSYSLFFSLRGVGAVGN